ncbi:hypothetical protein J3E72DRAFT_381509 [Bipolaris maydis]|nr:hypothetical protein BM1_09633 [Bipolaris maydis]KAJ6203100.1 hypothetical protein J3E72DRAFT_381509 [Bipolaris maydis]
MSVSLSPGAQPKKTNYRVRFRHGVFPDAEGQATRADIKKYDYFFAAGQRWVGTEGKLNFIDESRLVAEECENPASAGERRASKHVNRSRTSGRPSSFATTSPRKRERRLPLRSGTWDNQAQTSADSQRHIPPPWHVRRHTSPAPGSVSNYSSLDEPSPADSQSEGPSPRPHPAANSVADVAWPLSDPIEAYLFRFWIEKAAVSLDITSPVAVFKRVVPRLAFENAMLMNAILMTSAQHVLRHDPHFPAGPFVYHDRILQDLIPYLAEKGRIEDEATLVTAMLLRTFEEFHAGTQGQTHLSTYELFHGPEGWLLDMSSPVVQACLMIHVNSEVCQALLNRPSLRIDYGNSILPALALPEDEASWGSRIVWLNARILQWMATDNRTADERQYLSNLVDEWELMRPTTFDAFFYKEDSYATGYFPELWFSSPCHADANQHLRLCRIALAASYLDAEFAAVER